MKRRDDNQQAAFLELTKDNRMDTANGHPNGFITKGKRKRCHRNRIKTTHFFKATVEISFSRASKKNRPTDRTEYPKISPKFPPKKSEK